MQRIHIISSIKTSVNAHRRRFPRYEIDCLAELYIHDRYMQTTKINMQYQHARKKLHSSQHHL